jgi:hypothetical protein
MSNGEKCNGSLCYLCLLSRSSILLNIAVEKIENPI